MTFAEEMHKLADEHNSNDDIVDLLSEIKSEVRDRAERGFYNGHLEIGDTFLNDCNVRVSNPFYVLIHDNKRLVKQEIKKLGLKFKIQHPMFFDTYCIDLAW